LNNEIKNTIWLREKSQKQDLKLFLGFFIRLQFAGL